MGEQPRLVGGALALLGITMLGYFAVTLPNAYADGPAFAVFIAAAVGLGGGGLLAVAVGYFTASRGRLALGVATLTTYLLGGGFLLLWFRASDLFPEHPWLAFGIPLAIVGVATVGAYKLVETRGTTSAV